MGPARTLDSLLPQVKRNCMISDASHWGYSSLCGLLMRLRGLYRSERGLMPWDPIDERDILKWIETTEASWAEMAGLAPEPISIGKLTFDPLDSDGINAAVGPVGLLYGAGHGMFMKPVFFLAELRSKENLEGCDVLTAGREYARDLSTHPAMLRENTIVARAEIATLLMWERFEEFRAKKTPGLLGEAFSACGIGHEAGAAEVSTVAETELRAYIHHEIGEAVEGRRLGPKWAEMLALAVSHCGRADRTHAFLRAVKDVLADTTEKGMIGYITRTRSAGSLFFMVTSLYGYRFGMLKKVREAAAELLKRGDWKAVEEASAMCHAEAVKVADDLLGGFVGGSEPEALMEAVKKCISAVDMSR